jgi:hypothetical protein
MPTNALDRTLALVGEASTLTPEMSRRIVTYGIERRKSEILQVMARREDLDETLNAKLLAYGDAKVTAERARVLVRNGRIDEVAELLKKEKRVTVTKGIAETEGLPEAIYRAILATKRQTVLVALANNTSASEELREEAIVAALTGGFYNYPRNLQTALLGLPNAAKRLLSEDLTPDVWRFTLDNCPCSSEDRSALALLLAGQFDKWEPDTTQNQRGLLGNWRSGSEGLWDYVAIANTLLTRPLDKEAADQLAGSVTAASRRADKAGLAAHLGERLRHIAEDLGKVRTDEDLNTRLEKATSSKDVLDALTAYSGGTLTLAEMHKLLSSPWFSPEHWRYIQHSWHLARALRDVLGDASPAAVAYMRVRIGWFGGLDDLLNGCSDPGETLKGIISLERTWRLGLAAEIIASKYLTEAHVTAMTLDMLAGGATGSTVDTVSDLITKATANPEAWDALVGIGAEFDGSIAELLETSKNL